MDNYLLFIGGSDIDYFYEVETFLKKGDACIAKPLEKRVGGCVLNAACVSGSLGSNVKYIDYLKENDVDSKLIVDCANKYHLDTSFVKYDKKATNGQCLIMKKGDEKCIYVLEPKRPFYKEDREFKSLILNASYIYSLMHTIKISFKNVELLKEAKRRGTKIIFDGSSQYKEAYEIEMLLELADGLFLNKDAYKRFEEKCDFDIVDYLLGKGCEFICVTDGSKGVKCFSKEGTYKEKAYKIDVVDSTGAGDSFAGTFLHYRNEGKSYEECLKYACASGAYACSKKGGQAGAIKKEKLISFMKMMNK